MKASIRKISEMTGFSPATVSNALNHKRGVNAKTAGLIFEAAEQIGYAPERQLKKIKFVIYRKNGRILDDSQFHPAVIEGVEREAKNFGYETVYTHIDCQAPDFKEQIKKLSDDFKTAVILLGTEMLEEDLALFADHKYPLILLDGWSDRLNFDSVLISNTDSAYQATRYFVEKGHTKIGYIGGDFRIQAFRYREKGYLNAMYEEKLPVKKQFTVYVGTQIETAYEGMKEYLKNAKELPTAFFADNDAIAMGAMQALREQGIRIPEEISVIGFDDLAFGRITSPSLTTLHVHKQEMGMVAVQRLMKSIEDGSGIRMKIQVCADFVERDSVADKTVGI